MSTTDEAPVWVAISTGPDGAFSLGVFRSREGAVAAAQQEGNELGIDCTALDQSDGDATAIGGSFTYAVSVQHELGIRP